MPEIGSLIIHNAHILTLEEKQPQASACAIVAGRIRAVGGEEIIPSYLSQADQIIDAAGATLLPGFIDTHVHFTLTGLGSLGVDLAGLDSIEAILARIAEAAAGRPADWLVLALNFQPELIPGERFPSAGELAQAADGRPVYVMESGGHWSAVSPAALALLDLPADTPGLQRNATGDFSGVLRDVANTAAFSAFWQRYAEQVGLEKAFQRAAAEAIRGGVTTLHALDDLEHVRALLAYQENLPVRIVPYTQSKDLAAVQALGLGQIGGCGQVMVDGDFGPHTAALLEPYADQPDVRGVLYYSDAELENYVNAVHEAGLQLGLHCIGSGAIEQLLNAYQKALERRPRADHRHRIEHFQLPAPGQAERARALGVALAMQPAFNHFWPHDQGYPHLLGKERANRLDPLRSVLEAGLTVAYGSDSPVTPMRPLLWIHSAVNHSNPAERVPVETALRLCTTTGAWLAFEEEEKGTVSEGKLGDLVLLSENPLTADPARLKDIAVLKTIVGGRVVYEA